MKFTSNCDRCYISSICKLQEKAQECLNEAAKLDASDCIELCVMCQRFIQYPNSLDTSCSTHTGEHPSMYFGDAQFCDGCVHRDICNATEKIKRESLQKLLKKADGMLKVGCMFSAYDNSKVVMAVVSNDVVDLSDTKMSRQSIQH